MATGNFAELTATKNDLISKGVKYCVGAYVDIHGVPKGKIVPIAHFEEVLPGARNSIPATPSMEWDNRRMTMKLPPCPISAAACSSPGSRR